MKFKSALKIISFILIVTFSTTSTIAYSDVESIQGAFHSKPSFVRDLRLVNIGGPDYVRAQLNQSHISASNRSELRANESPSDKPKNVLPDPNEAVGKPERNLIKKLSGRLYSVVIHLIVIFATAERLWFSGKGLIYSGEILALIIGVNLVVLLAQALFETPLNLKLHRLLFHSSKKILNQNQKSVSVRFQSIRNHQLYIALSANERLEIHVGKHHEFELMLIRRESIQRKGFPFEYGMEKPIRLNAGASIEIVTKYNSSSNAYQLSLKSPDGEGAPALKITAHPHLRLQVDLLDPSISVPLFWHQKMPFQVQMTLENFISTIVISGLSAIVWLCLYFYLPEGQKGASAYAACLAWLTSSLSNMLLAPKLLPTIGPAVRKLLSKIGLKPFFKEDKFIPYKRGDALFSNTVFSGFWNTFTLKHLEEWPIRYHLSDIVSAKKYPDLVTEAELLVFHFLAGTVTRDKLFNRSVENELVDWIRKKPTLRILAMIITGWFQANGPRSMKLKDALRELGITREQFVELKYLASESASDKQYDNIKPAAQEDRAPPAYLEQIEKRNVYRQLGDSEKESIAARVNLLDVPRLQEWLLQKFHSQFPGNPEAKIRSIIVFGSYVYGVRDDPTDIDILVVMENAPSIPRTKITSEISKTIFHDDRARFTTHADIHFLTHDKLLESRKTATLAANSGIVLMGPELIDEPLDEIRASETNRVVWASDALSDARQMLALNVPKAGHYENAIPVWRAKAVRRIEEAALYLASIDPSVVFPPSEILNLRAQLKLYLESELPHDEFQTELFRAYQRARRSLYYTRASLVWRKLNEWSREGKINFGTSSAGSSRARSELRASAAIELNQERLSEIFGADEDSLIQEIEARILDILGEGHQLTPKNGVETSFDDGSAFNEFVLELKGNDEDPEAIDFVVYKRSALITENDDPEDEEFNNWDAFDFEDDGKFDYLAHGTINLNRSELRNVVNAAAFLMIIGMASTYFYLRLRTKSFIQWSSSHWYASISLLFINFLGHIGIIFYRSWVSMYPEWHLPRISFLNWLVDFNANFWFMEWLALNSVKKDESVQMFQKRILKSTAVATIAFSALEVLVPVFVRVMHQLLPSLDATWSAIPGQHFDWADLAAYWAAGGLFYASHYVMTHRFTRYRSELRDVGKIIPYESIDHLDSEIESLFQRAGVKRAEGLQWNEKGPHLSAVSAIGSDFLDSLPIQKGQHAVLLDAGHGQGEMAILLAHHFPSLKIIGIEFDDGLFGDSEKLLRAAEEELFVGPGQVEFHHGDFNDARFSSQFESADYVYYFDGGTNNLPQLFQTLKQRLKPAARIINLGLSQRLRDLLIDSGLFSLESETGRTFRVRVFKRSELRARMSNHPTRREFLGFLGAASFVGVGGCMFSLSDSFNSHLVRNSISEEIDFEIPEGVTAQRIPRYFYKRDNGVKIALLDEYLSDAELQVISDTLDSLPFEHLQYVKWIASQKVNVSDAFAGSTYGNGFVLYVLDGTDKIARSVLGASQMKKLTRSKLLPQTLTKSIIPIVLSRTVSHEIGHIYQLANQDSFDEIYWSSLYSDSKGDSLNFATNRLGLNILNDTYGTENEFEDFATFYETWTYDSEAVIREAVNRLDRHPYYFLKMLFLARQFLSSDFSSIAIYKVSNENGVPKVDEAPIEVTDRYIRFGNLKLFPDEEGRIAEYQWEDGTAQKLPIAGRFSLGRSELSSTRAELRTASASNRLDSKSELRIGQNPKDDDEIISALYQALISERRTITSELATQREWFVQAHEGQMNFLKQFGLGLDFHLSKTAEEQAEFLYPSIAPFDPSQIVSILSAFPNARFYLTPEVSPDGHHRTLRLYVAENSIKSGFKPEKDWPMIVNSRDFSYAAMSTLAGRMTRAGAAAALLWMITSFLFIDPLLGMVLAIPVYFIAKIAYLKFMSFTKAAFYAVEFGREMPIDDVYQMASRSELREIQPIALPEFPKESAYDNFAKIRKIFFRQVLERIKVGHQDRKAVIDSFREKQMKKWLIYGTVSFVLGVVCSFSSFLAGFTVFFGMSVISFLHAWNDYRKSLREEIWDAISSKQKEEIPLASAGIVKRYEIGPGQTGSVLAEQVLRMTVQTLLSVLFAHRLRLFSARSELWFGGRKEARTGNWIYPIDHWLIQDGQDGESYEKAKEYDIKEPDSAVFPIMNRIKSSIKLDFEEDGRLRIRNDSDEALVLDVIENDDTNDSADIPKERVPTFKLLPIRSELRNMDSLPVERARFGYTEHELTQVVPGQNWGVSARQRFVNSHGKPSEFYSLSVLYYLDSDDPAFQQLQSLQQKFLQELPFARDKFYATPPKGLHLTVFPYQPPKKTQFTHQEVADFKSAVDEWVQANPNAFWIRFIGLVVDPTNGRIQAQFALPDGTRKSIAFLAPFESLSPGQADQIYEWVRAHSNSVSDLLIDRVEAVHVGDSFGLQKIPISDAVYKLKPISETDRRSELRSDDEKPQLSFGLRTLWFFGTIFLTGVGQLIMLWLLPGVRKSALITQGANPIYSALGVVLTVGIFVGSLRLMSWFVIKLASRKRNRNHPAAPEKHISKEELLLENLGLKLFNPAGEVPGRIGYDTSFASEMLLADLIMVPHGMTDANAQGRMQGSHDASDYTLLNEDGKRQAEEGAKILFDQLRDKLEKGKPIHFLVSPLARAWQTAQYFVDYARSQGFEIHLEPDLDVIEMEFGDAWGDIELPQKQQALKTRYLNGDALVRPPKGETYLEFLARVREFIRNINYLYSGDTVVVFGHRTFATALKVLTNSSPKHNEFIQWTKLVPNDVRGKPIQISELKNRSELRSRVQNSRKQLLNSLPNQLTLTVKNKRGIHMIPSTEIARLAGDPFFNYLEILISKNGSQPLSAREFLNISQLGAEKGEKVTFTFNSSGEEKELAKVVFFAAAKILIEDNHFGKPLTEDDENEYQKTAIEQIGAKSIRLVKIALRTAQTPQEFIDKLGLSHALTLRSELRSTTREEFNQVVEQEKRKLRGAKDEFDAGQLLEAAIAEITRLAGESSELGLLVEPARRSLNGVYDATIRALSRSELRRINRNQSRSAKTTDELQEYRDLRIALHSGRKILQTLVGHDRFALRSYLNQRSNAGEADRIDVNQSQTIAILPNLAQLPDLVYLISRSVTGKDQLVVLARTKFEADQINYLVPKELIDSGKVMIADVPKLRERMKKMPNSRLVAFGIPEDQEFAAQMERLLSGIDLETRIASIDRIEVMLGISGLSEQIRFELRARWAQAVAA